MHPVNNMAVLFITILSQSSSKSFVGYLKGFRTHPTTVEKTNGVKEFCFTSRICSPYVLFFSTSDQRMITCLRIDSLMHGDRTPLCQKWNFCHLSKRLMYGCQHWRLAQCWQKGDFRFHPVLLRFHSKKNPCSAIGMLVSVLDPPFLIPCYFHSLALWLRCRWDWIVPASAWRAACMEMCPDSFYCSTVWNHMIMWQYHFSFQDEIHEVVETFNWVSMLVIWISNRVV